MKKQLKKLGEKLRSVYLGACKRLGDGFMWVVDTADILPWICIGFIAGSVAYAVLAECAGCAT